MRAALGREHQPRGTRPKHPGRAGYSSGGQHDPAQVERVAAWIQKGLEQKPKSSILIIAMANLRERQGRFQDAEACTAGPSIKGKAMWSRRIISPGCWH